MKAHLAVLVACTGCLSEPNPPACRAAGALPNASFTPDVDTDPWLSEDRLELLFASMHDRSTIDLFHATRASVDDQFDPPHAIEELSTTAIEGGPFVTDDGRTIWFTRGANDTSTAFYTATRTDRTAAWDGSTEVKSLGVGGHPSFTSDGLTIYFEREDPVTTVYAIFTATRSSVDSLDFTMPKRVDELQPPAMFSIGNPSISGDGNVIYYDSFAVNDMSPQIVFARRGADGKFGTPEPVVEVNAPQFTTSRSARLLRDNRTIVFAAVSAKDQDLYIYCE